MITQDIDNPLDEDPNGLQLASRVGLYSPSAATQAAVLRALRSGEFFRLLDADGNVYYVGRCWCVDGAGAPQMFGPLDGWGRADVGAIEIQYRVNGRWESL